MGKIYANFFQNLYYQSVDILINLSEFFVCKMFSATRNNSSSYSIIRLFYFNKFFTFNLHVENDLVCNA
jgi:hypothetical protein